MQQSFEHITEWDNSSSWIRSVDYVIPSTDLCAFLLTDNIISVGLADHIMVYMTIRCGRKQFLIVINCLENKRKLPTRISSLLHMGEFEAHASTLTPSAMPVTLKYHIKLNFLKLSNINSESNNSSYWMALCRNLTNNHSYCVHRYEKLRSPFPQKRFVKLPEFTESRERGLMNATPATVVEWKACRRVFRSWRNWSSAKLHELLFFHLF